MATFTPARSKALRVNNGTIRPATTVIISMTRFAANRSGSNGGGASQPMWLARKTKSAAASSNKNSMN